MPTDPEFWSVVVLQGITLAALLISWAGLLIPVFPGLLIMWLSTLMYAIVQQLGGRMNWVDWLIFSFITLLAAGGGVLDNIIIASRMRGQQIPWSSILLAALAGLLASLFFTPLIGILASLLALYAVESRRLRDAKKGLKSARLYMVAWGWAFAAVFSIGGLIILLWITWAFL